MVVIVVDPEKGIVDGNLIAHMGNGPCRHLGGCTPGNYYCKIHDYPWYTETPCFSHSQVEESKDSECRMGRYVIDKWKKENDKN